MNKLETAVKRIEAIKEKGLIPELKKHRAYYYKTMRKGQITKEEYIKTDETTMQILAGF